MLFFLGLLSFSLASSCDFCQDEDEDVSHNGRERCTPTFLTCSSSDAPVFHVHDWHHDCPSILFFADMEGHQNQSLPSVERCRFWRDDDDDPYCASTCHTAFRIKCAQPTPILVFDCSCSAPSINKTEIKRTLTAEPNRWTLMSGSQAEDSSVDSYDMGEECSDVSLATRTLASLATPLLLFLVLLEQ